MELENKLILAIKASVRSGEILLKNYSDEKQFRIITSGMPIKRTGYIRMMRNCLIAAGNSKYKSLQTLILKF